jgi:hypothetical protein
MARVECASRESGMLNPKDQIVAQELFDRINNSGRDRFSTISKSDFSVISANILNKGRHNSLMEIHKGGLTLKIRKGKRFWQDDGSRGFADISLETSRVKLDLWHPSANIRDNVLRQVHDIFVKPQLQSK